MDNDFYADAIRCFVTDGKPVSCVAHGCGHINHTYLVTTDTGRRYILQMLNGGVFHDPEGLMENVVAITRHIAAKCADPRGSLHLNPTADGRLYVRGEQGHIWRLFDYVENSLCLQTPETPEDFYQSAIAFGTFQRQLADFPAETLHETIPDFHNTPVRYRQLRQALAADVRGRAKDVGPEAAFVMAREAEAGRLHGMRMRGELPTRVTHNDTKLNNVMLDADTRKPLCVIDLDTVMPGLAAYDFGDSIRFGAATAAEDEKDLDKMEMDLDAFEIYTRGFLEACPDLTDLERQTLPLGAKTMTLECGVRFLTDYLAGDVYFDVHYPEHNLDRARTQFKLVADMEKKWDRMTAIVSRLSGT